MPCVYILRCADGSFYTGSTIDLDRRLTQHQCGEGAVYTRDRRPVQLLWFWEFERIDEAFGWEARIQGWSRRKKEVLMEHGLDAVLGWSARERRTLRLASLAQGPGEAEDQDTKAAH